MQSLSSIISCRRNFNFGFGHRVKLLVTESKQKVFGGKFLIPDLTGMLLMKLLAIVIREEV